MKRLSMRHTAFLVLVIVALLQGFCLAAETNCPEHFAYGEAPDLVNPELTAKSREICYAGFAVKHSGVTRTSLYSAEYLTTERLQQAQGIHRKNRFHADVFILADERAELHDYSHSGYDRGHLAPAADMPDVQAQLESFALSNVVPQNPGNNRGAWAQLEKMVRRLVQEHGRLYVITGPIFDQKPEQVGGAVSVPVYLFKAVLISEAGAVKAYLVENKDKAQVMEIAVEVLEEMAGLRLFPQRIQ